MMDDTLLIPTPVTSAGYQVGVTLIVDQAHRGRGRSVDRRLGEAQTLLRGLRVGRYLAPTRTTLVRCPSNWPASRKVSKRGDERHPTSPLSP